MTTRLFNVAILAGLVAIPVGHVHAQSNPWYIPPQAPTPMQPGSAVQYGAAPQLIPQGYVQAPQFGLGAAYGMPQQAPATVVVPQTATPYQYAAPSYGYAQPPATTGTVVSAPLIVGAPAHAATMQAGAVAYQPPPAAPAPTYTAPATQTVLQQPAPVYIVPAQPQPAGAPVYTFQPQVQVLGNYPPLGGDPTAPAGQPAAQSVQPPQAAPAAPVTVPGWGAPTALQYPGFAGPTTLSPLSPGLGAYPGLSPAYPAPFGAAPYLGLPFY